MGRGAAKEQKEYLRMFLAELIGTALLMLLGCMGCITNYDQVRPDLMGAFAFGLTVMLIIQTLGHVSGAHLNPAVTLATVLYKTLSPKMAIVYVVAQFAGASIGYGLLKVLVSDVYAPDGFCVTEINSNLSTVQGLAIEFVITAILILVCSGVWDKRNVNNTDSTPLRFGFAIAVISLGAGPLTGASMNTARSFAPLIYGGSWKDHWVYWVGPNAAAVFSFYLYKFLFGLPSDAESNEKESVHLEEIQGNNLEKV